MPLPIRNVKLRRGDRAKLERVVRSRTAPRRLVERAGIVLGSAEGQSGAALCARVGVSRPTVTRWLNRYEAGGLPALFGDRPRSGRPKRTASELDAEIIRQTLEVAPPDDGTHWSTRLIADRMGVSQTHVWRLWRAHGLTPHKVDLRVATDRTSWRSCGTSCVSITSRPSEPWCSR
jgi:transposase